VTINLLFILDKLAIFYCYETVSVLTESKPTITV
jgi:hypothetical protein